MKKTYIILLIIIILLTISLVIILKNKKKTVEINEIKHMHFGYSTGNMINAYVSYDIDYENNNYYATIKPNNLSEEDKLKVKISTETVDKVIEIIKKYEVQNWDGFNKNDQNVLDGNSFSLSIELTNNKSISAHGYMKWPKNYREVKEELDIIFMNIYNDIKK